MFNLKKIVPKPTEAIHPVDLTNRSAILEAKLLYTSMSSSEIAEAEAEIEKINSILMAPVA